MATPLHNEVLAANREYVASFGDKKSLALPPARKAAFLVCELLTSSCHTRTPFMWMHSHRASFPCTGMDARINPAAALGLKEGDAHVIRNAGGRASEDAIRSFVISHKLLGTQEWFVIHHTDCGMEYFKNADLAGLLEGTLASVDIVPAPGTPKGVAFVNPAGASGGSADGHKVDWLTIADQVASVKEDVAKIAGSSLVAPGIPVHGYIYNVSTGAIEHVVSAVTRS
jgi:carbonic anhydrase